MSVKGFLSPAAAAAVPGYVQRSFQTVLDMRGQAMVFHRADAAGELTLLPAQAVVIDLPQRDPQASGQLEAQAGTSRQLIVGELRGFDPLDVAVNDWFALDGEAATITTVLPVRYGIQRARFLIEEGRGR